MKELSFRMKFIYFDISSYFILFTESLSTRPFAIINLRYLETFQEL